MIFVPNWVYNLMATYFLCTPNQHVAAIAYYISKTISIVAKIGKAIHIPEFLPQEAALP